MLGTQARAQMLDPVAERGRQRGRDRYRPYQPAYSLDQAMSRRRLLYQRHESNTRSAFQALLDQQLREGIGASTPAQDSAPASVIDLSSSVGRPGMYPPLSRHPVPGARPLALSSATRTATRPATTARVSLYPGRRPSGIASPLRQPLFSPAQSLMSPAPGSNGGSGGGGGGGGGGGSGGGDDGAGRGRAAAIATTPAAVIHRSGNGMDWHVGPPVLRAAAQARSSSETRAAQLPAGAAEPSPAALAASLAERDRAENAELEKEIARQIDRMQLQSRPSWVTAEEQALRRFQREEEGVLVGDSSDDDGDDDDGYGADEDDGEAAAEAMAEMPREKASIVERGHPAGLLTPKMAAIVRLAWRHSYRRDDDGDELVCISGLRGPAPVTRHDIRTVRGAGWLNDEICNAYSALISLRCQRDPSLPRVHVFNTFFMPKLTRNGTGYDFAAVRRWTKKIDIFALDLVMVLLHEGVHWTLAVIDIPGRRLTYLDSMGSCKTQPLETLRRYLQDEHQHKKGTPLPEPDAWTMHTPGTSVPQQDNGSDCGVFMCTFAEHLSRRAPFQFSCDDMPAIRQRLVYYLMTMHLPSVSSSSA